MNHLTWLESLGNLGEQLGGQGNETEWNKTFNKARKIYIGKLTGFRIMDRDQMRRQMMEMINTQVTGLMESWSDKIKKDPSTEPVYSEKLLKLIHMLIEFCMEISQANFLFDQLLKKFQEQKKGKEIC